MTWASRSNLYGVDGARSLEAEKRLTDAYREVFMGKPSKDDKQLVLTDLAAESGFMAVMPANVSSDELRYQEGKRALFGRVFGYLSLSPSDLQELGNAARREIAVDNQQEN